MAAGRKLGKGRVVFAGGVRYDEGADLPADVEADAVVFTDAEDVEGSVEAAPAPVVTAKAKSSAKSG